MNMIWDLVIIGAGPAGMSAAIEARSHGLRVLVLDRQREAGGQIFRSAGSATRGALEQLGTDYARGQALVQAFLESGATFTGNANVWHIVPGRVYFSEAGQSHAVSCNAVLIATGGMERPVPLPGWTLPGVIGAGAADVLIKSASLAPSAPVILCGNGPLILQTAVHLKHFGITVAGIVMTGKLSNMLHAIPRVFGALQRPLYMAHGLGLGLRMFFGSRCHPASTHVAIARKDNGFEVSFRSLGKNRTLSGNTVLLHEGVISETRITRLARLHHCWNPAQRYWHVSTSSCGETNLDGIYCAGDVAGVRGADAAMAFGSLAGITIAYKTGHISLEERNQRAEKPLGIMRRCNAMQPFMDAVFSPNPDVLQPADDTVVCRCEELTAGELRKTITEGCYSLDGLKAQARPGMGTCQGRMCASAVAEMIAHATAVPLDKLELYHAQPPLFPLSLGELAAMQMPPDGL